MQQLGPDRFLAQNASLTSSRFGVPGYELRAGLMTYDDIQHPRINPFTGMPEVDPTGARSSTTSSWPPAATTSSTSSSSRSSTGRSWPPTWRSRTTTSIDPRPQRPGVRHAGAASISTPTRCSACAIRRRAPSGPSASTTSASAGPAGGTTFNYERQTLFGMPESTSGFIDAWGINDHGLDNLGLDRRDVAVPRRLPRPRARRSIGNCCPTTSS